MATHRPEQFCISADQGTASSGLCPLACLSPVFPGTTWVTTSVCLTITRVREALPLAPKATPTLGSKRRELAARTLCSCGHSLGVLLRPRLPQPAGTASSGLCPLACLSTVFTGTTWVNTPVCLTVTRVREALPLVPKATPTLGSKRRELAARTRVSSSTLRRAQCKD